MLSPRAAIGRDDGLIGEQGFEFARVILNIIRSQQRTLAVEGDGQAIGSISPLVVSKYVVDAKNTAVLP